MEEFSLKASIGRYLAPLTTLISFLTAVIYVTWFAATLDKRVTVVESHQVETEQRIDLFRTDLNTINTYQDQENSQFRTDVYAQLDQMSGRIEKIYTILLDAKKHETI